MLQDREYMRRQPPWRGQDPQRERSGMKLLFTLLIVNVVLYLLQFQTMEGFPLVPGEVKNGCYHELVTAVFLHSSFEHVFFNMFTLYVFGSILAPLIGGRKFLALFLFAGIFGNIFWLIPNWNQSSILVGASGALMGVIMVTALLLPNIEMFLLFIPFPIKLRTLAIVFIAIEVFSQLLSDGTSDVAYLAHIGGFIAGYIFAKIFLRNQLQWDPIARLFGRKNDGIPHSWTVRDEPRTEEYRGGDGPVTQRELDALLDKISRNGINSLSEQEMERLRRAREQMRGERN